MSHLLCPISRQPVQFCESAACLFFSWVFFFFCLIFDFFPFVGRVLLVFRKELNGGGGCMYVDECV